MPRVKIYHSNPETVEMIYISGCPRGATKYMHKVLVGSGLDVGHEIPGSNGCVGWNVLIKIPRPTCHQVREPLACIASMAKLGTRIFGAMEHHLGKDFGEDRLQMAANAYLHWNRAGIERAGMTYRVEDIRADLFPFKVKEEAIRTVSTATNARPKVPITWEDLAPFGLEDPIRRLGEELGYHE